MEGQAPFQLGVPAADLAGLTKIEGPFLSLYLPLEPEIDNASQKSRATWKAARQELEEIGAPANALDRIDDLVPDAHQHGRCLAAIAHASGLLHVEHGPKAPPATRFAWAPLPSLAPILEWRQLQPSHLLVLVDRTGADLVAFAGEDSLDRRQVGTVDDDPIRKVKPGGWSQRRYQERAEHTWENNAEAVVQEVSRMAKQFDASLIVAAGDVRALELLERDLPKELADRFVVAGGGRAAGTDREETLEEARRQVEILVDQETGAILDRLREEVGQRDLAVQGKDNTLEAASRAQIDTLLLYDDPEDDRPAYFTSDPIPVAATETRLEELGIEPRIKGRLIDVLIRAALGTGGSVRMIPGESGVADNVAALLRWTS
ncbi:MAG: hypothetical protein M3135_02505 [Actinomycetota bacterium]|nr:hypothetical protein [Actinomycetota bacterium]